MNVIKLKSDGLRMLRNIDSRLVSYNIEMAEVTGGTFWKTYTSEQLAGTEPFPPVKGPEEMESLMQIYLPINLHNKKLRFLARELGPAWVRVSGTWATSVYYDFDDHTGGKPPKGYQSVLTREQWDGVLDFIKAVGAKLLISVANCEGNHGVQEPWAPEQAKLILDYSKAYGVPVSAVEFMNEPNMLELSGAPKGYTAADYRRDQDAFCRFMRENYPEVLLVGPCSLCIEDFQNIELDQLPSCDKEELLAGTKEKLDVYSYHYYNGTSERLAAMGGHWKAEQALSEPYLDVAAQVASKHLNLRDKYYPGAPMWVTESGDACGGGTTWASTFLDVFRTLNELGRFAQLTDGIIFHNTLASSDYGLLERDSYNPRPNYYALLLWNCLMGTVVYESGEDLGEGVHVYVHSRKDGCPGLVYLVLNNSLTETISVELPAAAQQYTLTASTLRSPVMLLNEKPLILDKTQPLPSLCPVSRESGVVELPSKSVSFFVL